LAANIFGNRFGEVSDDANGPVSAWHRLGTTVARETKPSAIVDALIPYSVDKYPAGYQRPDGTWVAIDDRFHLIRSETRDDPKERDFGIVARNYEYEQPQKLFKQLDNIAEVWPLETYGVLGKGDKIFMLFNTGGTQIAGDPFSNYMLFLEQLDGKHAHEQMFTSIRVVCQNTLDMAMEQSKSRATVKHSSKFGADFLNVMELMTSLTSAKDRFTHIMERMYRYKLQEDEIAALMQIAIPIPERKGVIEMAEREGAAYNQYVQDETDKWLKNQKRAINAQTVLREEYNKLNIELPDRAGTAYNWIQAVAAYTDHRTRTKDAALSPAVGQGAFLKDRAFKATVELVGA
jgi:phage/plasmid-like protein (TIGR03299 family)